MPDHCVAHKFGGSSLADAACLQRVAALLLALLAAWRAAADWPGFAGGLGWPLAALHLVTLGVLAMTAIGASLQLLPVATRYEQEGGGTETTTERRIVFSPEIRGRRIGTARAAEIDVGELAGRAAAAGLRPAREALWPVTSPRRPE